MKIRIVRLTTLSNAHDARMENNLSRPPHSCMEILARTLPHTMFLMFRWNHFENAELIKIEDLLLRQETGGDCVSAVFQYISH